MSERFAQCDESCTADCGHCKGQPFAAMRDEIEALKRDRQWELNRANEAARLSADARDQADDLRREIERLNERVAIVESDRSAWDAWAFRVVETDGQDARVAIGKRLAESEHMLKDWQSALKLRADELEETRAKLAAARSEVEELRALREDGDCGD